MRFLEFCFQSFWIFIGVVVLIVVILDGIAEIIRALKK